MDLLFSLMLQCLTLFESLVIFFFTPLGDVPGALISLFSPGDLMADVFYVIFDVIGQVAPWLFNIPLAYILVGSGLTILLLWRVVKLFLPVSI